MSILVMISSIVLGGFLFAFFYLRWLVVDQQVSRPNWSIYRYLLQLHISTLLIFTCGAAGVLYLNFSPKAVPGRNQQGQITTFSAYGWPKACFTKKNARQRPGHPSVRVRAWEFRALGWDVTGIIVNAVACLVLLAVATFGWECWLSLRDAPQEEEDDLLLIPTSQTTPPCPVEGSTGEEHPL